MRDLAQRCDVALTAKSRFIATPDVSKHRIFVWMPSRSPVQPADHSLRSRRRLLLRRPTLPHPRTLGAARWARSCARPRAASATPPPPPSRPSPSPGRPAGSRRTIRACRPSPRRQPIWWRSATRGSIQPAHPKPNCKQRTLTNLYNARPAWLDLAHRALDAAVLAAYGWPVDLSDDEILTRLLALNLARARNSGDLARRLLGAGRRFAPERAAVAELIQERAAEG